MRCPFSLFKKKTGNGFTWYVRFWNEKARDYTIFRSTGILAEGKRKRRSEAETKAWEILKEIRFEMESADRPLIPYLEEFWKSDSPYVKECANIKKKPLKLNLSLSSRQGQESPVGRERIVQSDYLFFVGLTRRKSAVDNNLTGRTLNSVLSTMRVAVHYAVDREELDRDPFSKVKPATETPLEKGVLKYPERAKLINATPTDPLSRLAVLLGLLCGMRMGEIRGLQWGDIDNGIIHLTHNFVHMDGLKKPKRGKTRKVPYPAIVEKAFEEVRKITIRRGTSASGFGGGFRPASDSFVFESIKRPGTPMGETFFRNALRRELEGIGISAGKKATEDSPAVPSEQKKRNLTFHSLRHTFITLGRLDGVLTDLEIQAIAGHPHPKNDRTLQPCGEGD